MRFTNITELMALSDARADRPRLYRLKKLTGGFIEIPAGFDVIEERRSGGRMSVSAICPIRFVIDFPAHYGYRFSQAHAKVLT